MSARKRYFFPLILPLAGRSAGCGVKSGWPAPGLLLLAVCCLLLPGVAHCAENEDSIVIAAEEIRAMNAGQMADLLNHAPGVNAGNSSVSIHGSYKVKVFVDGRPINDPTSSYGGVQWELVSPDDVERIEILRGKGGARYGQDAAGGVILITTRRIRKLTGTVKASGGNHETAKSSANLQLKTGDWTGGVSGGIEITDGFKINNDKDRRRGGMKLAYAPGEEKRVAFSADLLEDDRGLSGRPAYPTPFSRQTKRNVHCSLQAQYGFLSSTAFYNTGRNHNTDESRNLDQTLRVSEWGDDLAVARTMGAWGELNVGAGWRQGAASGSSFENRREETVSAFAAHAFAWPAAHLSLNLGLRANHNSAFDNAVNPEIKLTWKKGDRRLSAAVSRTNNTPSFYQRFNRTSSTRPNPDLSMETADNYSLAYSFSPVRTLSCDLTVFHNRLSDRITYVYGDDGVGQYRNFGLVTYTGGDLALNWKPFKTLGIKGGYTYLEAMDEETDLWLTAKSRHKARLDLYWQPAAPVSVVVAGQYASKVFRDKSNTKTVPGYMLVDVRAEYAFRRFTLFCEIENLFDKTYYWADGLLAPPLTWLAGVTWRI